MQLTRDLFAIAKFLYMLRQCHRIETLQLFSILINIKLYRCFDAVYYRAQSAGTEIVCVQLYVFLLCCMPNSDISSLNHVIDRAWTFTK